VRTMRREDKLKDPDIDLTGKGNASFPVVPYPGPATRLSPDPSSSGPWSTTTSESRVTLNHAGYYCYLV
jgi:hypothetical protein